MGKRTATVHQSLQDFAAAVTSKMTQLTSGEPEDQVRGPFENLMSGVADALGWKVVCTGETPLPDRLGRPDYAVHLNHLLAGYVELKAPGVGANAKRFKGHNHDQFKRFSAIPNILYTDGNEWALYRDGELVDKIVRLSGDVAADGAKAAAPQDAQALERLLRGFFSWQPIIPTDRTGKIDLKGFAAMLAPLTRMLRDDVTDALKDPNSSLVQLAKDWRQLLFPDAPDEQFADAYAQTVAFALLLGRSEGADPLELDSAEKALSAQHNLLSRALEVLTDKRVREEMAASLDLLLRVIAAVPPATFRSGTGKKRSTGVSPMNHGRDGHATSIDPWLYFYEDFLAAYDPKLRKDAGAYYTPVEVVRCQVRLIDDLLVNRLNKPLGFADPGVVTLDPAAGTGTYLLGVIEHALGRVKAEQGAGAVAGQATELAKNLYGFELMVGPYAVTELRVSRALRDRGAALPQDGTHVYLTDTLESPDAEPPVLPFYLKPISEQHEKALKVKSNVPVIVCLGNPPYDRHEAATIDNKARTGGWVRWGDTDKGADAIFRAFLDPAVAAGHGVHVKNLYNLYVYFWRWALWKVFEQESSTGVTPVTHGRDGHATPGIVSFISASSYLDGDAFCGMREHMRRQCDEVWILDLGGEGRGTRKDDNVFAIQTPVAIAVAVRSSTGVPPVENHGRDGHATLNIRQGARLPHWTKESATYAVTFRLGDSLPKKVLDAWLFERENIVETAEQMGRPLSPDEEKRLDHLYSEKVGKYLDAGHGKCWMKEDRIARIVADALKYFDGDRYDLAAWCVMPNHVHVVVKPRAGHELSAILHSWKSFTAHEANKALKRKGQFWEEEYYDHLIRDEADYAHCVEYLLTNPEKAGLKNWKWVSSGSTGVSPVNHGRDGHATPAKVHYARIEGERDAKLATLDAIADFKLVKWQDCPEDWQAPFRPAGKGDYFAGPLLTDLMPWQHSGVQLKRTWPIGPDAETLERRWRGLLTAENRSEAFRGTGDREIDGTYRVQLAAKSDATPIANLLADSPVPEIQRYAYRSYDRHCIIADGRLMSRPRPDLWRAHGERQVYLTSLFSQALGSGPALTASALIPDLDHFRGSYGAKAAIPLYRTADASEANILPGLLELLSKEFGGKYHGRLAHDSRAGRPCYVSPEDFLAYVYGALAQPAFTARFHKELETRELRVPITKDATLFAKLRDAGARLLWLHTYGERFSSMAVPAMIHGRDARATIPRGAAKCTKAVPGHADGYPENFDYNETTKTLHVGDGEFAPVSPAVFAFEVSGLKVVQSWLKYRMKRGAGKKSSPLDDIRPERWTSQFTTELLELLWVLEATVEGYPEQAKLLEAVIAGDCFTADELPPVPEEMRKPPAARKPGEDLFDGIEDE